MKVCGLLSGGKDSNYAFYMALREGAEVSCIVSAVPAREDSWMFHRPLVELVKLQAEVMGFSDRYHTIGVSGVKESEVSELREGLRKLKAVYGFDTITVGGIASRYQYERFKTIAEDLGVKVYDPQWGMDPEEYMKELVRKGLVFVISQITTEGLDMRMLGVPVQELSQVEEILRLSRRYGFHPAFEGGEAETFVVMAPHFKKGICLRASREKIAEYQYVLSVSSAQPCDDVAISVDSEVYHVFRRRDELASTAFRSSSS